MKFLSNILMNFVPNKLITVNGKNPPWGPKKNIERLKSIYKAMH